VTMAVDKGLRTDGRTGCFFPPATTEVWLGWTRQWGDNV